MERLQSSLFDAAAKGCVNSLQQLLINDSAILERDLVNSFNETPLHVAAMLGHIDFVKKIIEINPQLVHELNLQKRSPLHLAAAAGHVEVVTALLSVSQLTCLARDRNGLTPVHVAAIKGRDEAVKLLLEAQPDAARMLAYEDKETILHLCVKNHQLEALKLIVTTLNEAEFLNSKDAHGNTALHLAAADKQVETTQFLLSMGAAAVEVNAQNRDSEILESSESSNNIASALGDHLHQLQEEMRRIVSRLDTSNNSSDEERRRRISEGLMVVAVLLAGMIFQTATNPPGGVWQEDNFLMDSKGHYVDPQGRRVSNAVDSQNNTVLYPRQAGHSVLARNNPGLYTLLCVYNTVGFTTSLGVIYILMTGFQSNKVLDVVFYVISFFAFLAVTTSYGSGVKAVTPKDLGNKILGFVPLLPLFLSSPLFLYMELIRKRLRPWRRPAEVVEDEPETETGRILRAGVSSSAVV